MTKANTKKIWKVRTVKNYPEAHNHLFIGQILQLTQAYIRMNCRTCHFGKVINSPKDIRLGSKGIRILPWHNIELINELPCDFDYINASIVLSRNSKMALSDGKTHCILSSSYDNKY